MFMGGFRVHYDHTETRHTTGFTIKFLDHSKSALICSTAIAVHKKSVMLVKLGVILDKLLS